VDESDLASSQGGSTNSLIGEVDGGHTAESAGDQPDLVSSDWEDDVFTPSKCIGLYCMFSPMVFTESEASVVCKPATEQPKLAASNHPGIGRSLSVGSHEKAQIVDGRGQFKDDSRQPLKQLQDGVASNKPLKEVMSKQVVDEVKMKEEDDSKMKQLVKAKNLASDVKRLLGAGDVRNKQISEKDVGKSNEPPTIKFNLQKVIVIDHLTCKQVSWYV